VVASSELTRRRSQTVVDRGLLEQLRGATCVLESIGIVLACHVRPGEVRERAATHVALQSCARDGELRRALGEGSGARGGVDRRPREQGARRVAETAEVLEEQRCPSRGGQGLAELPRVEARRRDTGEVRRFLEQRAGAGG